MSKLATVTALRLRQEPAEPPPSAVDAPSRETYWDRVQALRAELADLQVVG